MSRIALAPTRFVLLLAACTALLASSDRVRAQGAAPAAHELALTGDFVDRGPNRAASSIAAPCALDLVNRTGRELDVAIGGGTARLAVDDHLILRLPPGDTPVRAAFSGDESQRLEGMLLFERGRSYALVLEYRPVPVHDWVAPEPMDPAAGAAPEALPPRGVAAAPAPEPREPEARSSTPARTGSGRVDVGRKRKRDRKQ